MHCLGRVFLVVCLCLAAGAALAQSRVALVIGNGAYREASRLRNPVNDATDMARALGGMGYAVISGYDLDQRGMEDRVARFAALAAHADIAIVYYSGHGLQVNGVNYLLPVSAHIVDEYDLPLNGMPAQRLLKAMEGARQLRLLILDACRDNPFTAKMLASKSVSAAKGLAPIQAAGDGDTLVAYATRPGEVARDGDGAHSPYAEALLRLIATPGLPVAQLFGRVRDAVRASPAAFGQVPFTEGSLGDPSPSLIPGPAPVPAPSPAPPPLAGGYPVGVGQTFRDCADVCPEMTVIPAGRFMMGSPASEPGRSDDEGPQHPVTIARALAVGTYPVTFDEYDACVAAGGCAHRADDHGWGRGRRPVIDVNWDDAQAYLRWLGGRTGKPYRLLSEAEWEYAARGGTTTAHWWGDAIGRGHANCYDCGSTWDGKQTAPVGSFAANPFGLQDMLGNVWQWTEDCWHASYAGAPVDGAVWAAADCSRRVVRGGSWYGYPGSVRAAERGRYDAGNRSGVAGFRVARTPGG